MILVRIDHQCLRMGHHIRPDPLPSRNDIQFMINSALERQAKSTDELLCRLIEERDGKKPHGTKVNSSSSTCTISFTQTNPYTSGPSAGGTSMPNLSAQPMNHFHSRTTIEGSISTFRMS
jgi:ssRNA-specific RNase YbeY (16S rRNA maturation enzyme)